MKISQTEFNRIANAIGFAITRTYFSIKGVEPTAAFVTLMGRKMIIDYLDSIGIEEIEEE